MHVSRLMIAILNNSKPFWQRDRICSFAQWTWIVCILSHISFKYKWHCYSFIFTHLTTFICAPVSEKREIFLSMMCSNQKLLECDKNSTQESIFKKVRQILRGPVVRLKTFTTANWTCAKGIFEESIAQSKLNFLYFFLVLLQLREHFQKELGNNVVWELNGVERDINKFQISSWVVLLELSLT